MDCEWLGVDPEPEPLRPNGRHSGPDPLRANGSWGSAGLRYECEDLAATQPGARNDRLNRAAFSVGQMVAGGSIKENEAVDALIEACRACGLWDTEPEQCRKTIASGLAAGYEEPRYPPERPESTQEDEPVLESRAVNWAALWADPGTMEWLCEPIIPAGRLVALYSPPKVGKSLLMLELAVSISRGTTVLGAKCKRTPVLYLDYENAGLDVRDRLQCMGLSPADLGGLHYHLFPDLPPLDTAAGGATLLGMATDCGAGLVVIDTVSRAISHDENDAATWLDLYRHTLVALKARGCAVVRIDHTGKDIKKGMRGSSAKESDVDLIWRLEETVKGNSYLLKCEAQRIRVSETLINIERRGGPLGHHIDMRSITQTKEAALISACEDAGLPASAGRDQIRKVIEVAGLSGSNELLSRVAKRRQQSE